MRILIVEDHEELASLVAQGLGQAGFNCHVVSTAEQAREGLTISDYSLVVLDLGLPGLDGLDLLREIRTQKHSVPILITTARSTVTDRVNGLKLGADDYLVKPFALEELVARVEALLRRPHQMEDSILRAGNIEYSALRKTFSVNGTPYVLSARELTVLEILLRQKGRVVTRALIEGEVFGFGGEISSNAVEVYMHRLRKQLVESSANIEIHTVRGVGYILEEPK